MSNAILKFLKLKLKHTNKYKMILILTYTRQQYLLIKNNYKANCIKLIKVITKKQKFKQLKLHDQKKIVENYNY